MTYEIEVTPPTNTSEAIFNTNTTSVTVSDSLYWNTSYPTYWYYPTTIYMYQLVCPRCKTTNWGQLDILINCKGTYKRKPCEASLKAVSKRAEYEVEVG